MRPLYSTILASFGGILTAIGFAYAPMGYFLPIGAALFGYGLSATIGSVAFPGERPGMRLAFGGLGTVALTAAAGAAVYWTYALNDAATSGLLIVLPWLAFAISPLLERIRLYKLPELLAVEKSEPIDTLGAILLVLAAGFDVLGLRALAGAATSEAIRSPWDVTPPIFFVWLFLASLALMAFFWRNRSHHLSLLALVFHLFTVLSPTLLVYVVGYGFDPFIHIATERLIAEEGFVAPKTPYYLGQYAIVVMIAKLFRIAVGTVDRLLLPVLAALYIPLGAVHLLRRGFKIERHAAVLSALGVLMLPLASFVSTTPQGLGNLFALMTFLLGASWLHDHRPSLAYVLLMAGASLAVHPLSGAPAVLFVGFLALFKMKEGGGASVSAFKAMGFLVLLVAAVLAVPAMFALNAGRLEAVDTEALAQAVPQTLTDLGTASPVLESRFDPIIDFVQLAAANHVLLLVGLALIGTLVLWRKKGYRRTAWVVGSLAAGLWCSAFILRHGISYAGVADYEQQAYADRLTDVLLLALAPLAFAGVAWWWRHLRTTDGPVRAFHVVLMAALTVAFAYANFPRNDAFASSRGYSTSIHDVSAVREIEERAGGAAYIVLADQSVSAAALQEFGFSRYYGDQYFYPIPTGNPLYRRYLDMVEHGPERATMDAAMRSVGVSKGFLVINDYWYGSEALIAKAKKTADTHFEVDGGKVYVFEYSLRGM